MQVRDSFLKSVLEYAIGNRFQTPDDFMDWLKSENVQDTIPIDKKNNNNNPLQSISDIKYSKHANCVDIALAVHNI